MDIKAHFVRTAEALRKLATGKPTAQAAPVADEPAVPADEAKPYRIVIQRDADGNPVSVPATLDEAMAYSNNERQWRRIG